VIVRYLKFLPVLALSVLAAISQSQRLAAQVSGPAAPNADGSALAVLPNHRPAWASPSNDVGEVPADRMLNAMTLVLARSPEQQASFESLLARQQDPASADYHHWLTSAEIAKRFGPSEENVASLKAWLESQGLQVQWTAPSRGSLGFQGTAASANRAFNTTLHEYNVNGKRLLSPSTDPTLPAALAPLVKAVRGLFTIEERPMSNGHPGLSPAPGVSFGGYNYVGPADFATIYNIPSEYTGAGATIGIVDEARSDFADYTNFRAKTGSTFPNPTEIIPTAYGGIDPGPAQTAPSSNGWSGDQVESEIDVTRAGSVAPGAKLLLVVSSQAGGGIGSATEYLAETDPAPAQVISISWGGCESSAGPSGVAYWDSLFQTASAKGITVLTISGDSGASGCDPYNAAPPANPQPNSPNYIASSTYATCLGGTEFNDTADPSKYWGTNGPGLSSAKSYIPEGAWNEPMNGSQTQAASSGGGVSTVIATPSWQTGTGVPAARAGRYTPDISFSSSGHDGYFGCFAAAGYGCVSDAQGNYGFFYFDGTSNAAPDMAGVVALLNQKDGLFQGNLNPQIYHLAATEPAVFHDATVTTSGVANCTAATPSICNNSIPSPTSLTGGQAGYVLTAGYDEVTGLGSLNIANFLSGFSPAQVATPVFTPAAGTYTGTQSVTLADTTPDATIYYTTNGTTPTTASTKYTAAIEVAASETIEALAVASGHTNSAVAKAVYTIENQAATPTFTPGPGLYTSQQKVAIADTTPGAVLYYTVNGTTPTAASAKYTAPILVSQTTAIEALAIAPGYGNSKAASLNLTIVGSPSALAAPATAIATPDATLNAVVNTLGLAGSYYFQYGTSGAALTTLTAKAALSGAATPVAVSAKLATLKTKTTYYFQVVVATAAGTALGEILNFTTD